MSSLIFNNVSSSPAAVGSGKSQLYMKTDGKTYMQSESNAEQLVDRGKILQVVTEYSQGNESSTTGSLAHDLLYASITPSSASSKILATFSVQWDWYPGNYQAANGVLYRSIDGATSEIVYYEGLIEYKGSGGNGNHHIHTWNKTCVDQPRTASPIVYNLRFGSDRGSSGVNYPSIYVGRYASSGGQRGLPTDVFTDPSGSTAGTDYASNVLTLMEIAG